jgi:hypothetical protein
MTSTASLEIKVVYDASKRRGGKTIVRPSPIRPGRRPGGGVVLVSVLNLVVAGGMYYATWWRVDPFLYITMMKKTPIDVPPDFGSSGFFVPRPVRVDKARPGNAPPFPRGDAPGELEGAPGDATREEGDRADAKSAAQSAARWGGKTAQVMIPAAAYGWLTLATAGACALALAGGAGFGATGGRTLRLIGMILTLGLIAGLAFAVFKVWSQYGMTYKPDHLRMGMGALILLFATAGLMMAGHVRGLTRLAGAMVILAGVGSAGGVWLWSQCGALEAGQAIVIMMALVFAAHSVWGWILFPLAGRLRA